ncbi:MAG: segregation/condensation protein A [Mogibacterium sp.]|nr:segregation/condensation protein A [Mogibacterium sp.]
MYKVRIEQFEGPFDLLVYLLESARMDIYDIRVAEITEQYIDYLKEMDELNIEVGSEFIVLAAVLIRLKSRMLLPRVNEAGEIVMEEDPRLELVSRLQEYMQIKKLAEKLQEREEYCQHIHAKPGEDISRYLEAPDELLRTDTDQFVRAFLAFLEKRKKLSEVRKRYEQVRRERASIEDRISYMTAKLERRLAVGGKVFFSELLPDNADRYDVTLSFMSLLEMIRTQNVDAVQREMYGEIEVSKRRQEGLDG